MNQGNTTLNLFSGDLLVGNATLNNLMLRPGNHSTPVEGIIDLGILFKNLPQVLKDQASSLKDGNLELKTIGTRVVYEGVEVPYYTKVMQGLELTATIPVGGLLTNTIEGLNSQNNPFANLSLSKPEGSGDSSSNISGLLDNLSQKRDPGPDPGPNPSPEDLAKALSAYL